MFRRGITSLAMAGTLIVAIAVPSVMADTSGGNADTYQGFGAWDDGDSNVNVGATIGTINGESVRLLDIGSFLVQDITCKKGNKTTPGIILNYIFGESTDAVVKIDKALGTATASATIDAQHELYNSCTGSDVITQVTVSATLDLTATTKATTTKSRSVTTFPDGSKETFTDRNDSREAGGSMSIGSAAYPAEFGQISHDVSTDVLTPPPHH
jgi:hypothetical protein